MSSSNADVLEMYNSGSWKELRGHSKAGYIWDWWLLGNESAITQASGSALSSGTAVTSLSPELGSHTLSFATSANSGIYVSDGIVEDLKSTATVQSEFET